MATFYYNRYSGESFNLQWRNYLQEQSYHKEVIDSVDKIAEQSRKERKNLSNEQITAMQESTSVVCGTLNSGFELLSENLQEISYGINDLKSEVNSMSSMLDWNLSLFIEQQRITNLLLGNIAVLLRIPDIQKERQYYIEQGIKFLKNSISDNDYYDDALKNLLKAEAIESTDYFVLHRIGMIYLHSIKHQDLIKAEEYFKKAVKYSIAETNSGASVSTNYLSKDINESFTNNVSTIDSIKLQTAESYLFAARSCYIQGKFSEAAALAGKAYNLVPQLLEAGFTQAKALAADNNEVEAVKITKSVISRDRFYSIKIASDLDLCPKGSIKLLLKYLQEEATRKAVNLLEGCKKIIIPGSNAKNYLDKIERLISRNTFLASKRAIDLLENNIEWNFCEPFSNQNQSIYLNEIISIVNSFSGIKFYKKNNSFIPIDAEFINSFRKIINEETQWIFPSFNDIQNKPEWAKQIKSKSGTYNIRLFIEAEKNYVDGLEKIINELKETLQKRKQEYDQYVIDFDRKNYYASVRSGISNGFLGIIGGIMAGSGVAVIINVGACASGGNINQNYNVYVAIICELIASVIGAISGYRSGFKSKRIIL